MSQTEVGDVGPEDDRASTFAESVMKGLSLQRGATLLLAAAWVTSEDRLYYDMFGEAVGFDITCGTNAERRPLARGTLTTAKGKKRPILQLIPTITVRMGFLLAIYNSLSYIVSNSKLPANRTDNN
jgi:hypothetical protein